MGALWAKIKDLWTKKLEVCLVGLENSGKTTLLNVLSMGHAIETLPTVGLNVKIMKKEGVSMKVWDLGGQQRFRAEWPRYTSGCNVIIFVVDANDVERIPVARKELHQLLEDRNLARIPLLVCLNKIDLEPHLTKEEVIKQLNLDYITENPWIVIPISAVKQTNLVDVVNWLVKNAQ